MSVVGYVLPIVLLVVGLVLTIVVWRRQRATGVRPTWIYVGALVGVVSGGVLLGLALRH